MISSLTGLGGSIYLVLLNASKAKNYESKMNALKPYYDAILNEGKTNKLQSNENFVKKCTSKLKATLSGIINKPVIKKP